MPNKKEDYFDPKEYGEDFSDAEIAWLDAAKLDEDRERNFEEIVEEHFQFEQKERQKLAKEIAKELKRTYNEDEKDKIYTKEDISNILKIKDNGTILRLFRVMVRDGYAMKIGKSYRISKQNFDKFLRHLEGQEFDF